MIRWISVLDLIARRLAAPLAVARRRVRGVGEQAVQHLLGQHAAVQQRVEDRVVQRLHRPVVVALRIPRVVEAAREQQIGQLRDERLEVDLVEQVFDVAANSGTSSSACRASVRRGRFSCSTSSCPWPAIRRPRPSAVRRAADRGRARVRGRRAEQPPFVGPADLLQRAQAFEHEVGDRGAQRIRVAIADAERRRPPRRTRESDRPTP